MHLQVLLLKFDKWSIFAMLNNILHFQPIHFLVIFACDFVPFFPVAIFFNWSSLHHSFSSFQLLASYILMLSTAFPHKNNSWRPGMTHFVLPIPINSLYLKQWVVESIDRNPSEPSHLCLNKCFNT